MLCSECKTIFAQQVTFVQKKNQKPRWVADYSYDITIRALQNKANDCFSCRGILRQVAAHLKNNATRIQAEAHLCVMYHLWVMVDTVEHMSRLQISAVLDGEKLGTDFMCFDPEQPETKCTSLNTGADESLAFIKECLERCHRHHLRCRLVTPRERWNPTRLIEVQQSSLKLVELGDSLISEPYATLSHCWGGAKILKLLSTNINDLKHSIQYKDLPKTFQDAIGATRRLGIPYIWIDSLCIIQDSDEDWQTEAKTMLKVYEHAVFNLAATHSTDSFGGLFKDRNPELLPTETVAVEAGSLRGRYHLVNWEYFMEEIDNAPLNRRCWVAQERMLSKRVIHFASEQVIWDCTELTACEALPQGTRVWPESARGQNKIGCKQGSHFLALPETINQGLGQWARIVNTYSACGLTVLGDKLVALAGMADYLGNALNLEYCAGLWRSKLEMQLAWYVEHLQAENGARNDLAPSWSWASMNGAVALQRLDLYEGYDLRSLASVIDVQLHRKVNEHRGEKLEGFLQLQCVLNPVELKGTVERHYLEGSGMGHTKRIWLDSTEVFNTNGLYFIPLFEVQYGMSLTEKWNLSSEIRGILVRSFDGEAGAFQRCGHVYVNSFVHRDTRDFDQSYKSLTSPSEKAGLPCKGFDIDKGHLIVLK